MREFLFLGGYYTGKSSTLNRLVGKRQFRSGHDAKSATTKAVSSITHNGIKYTDTPPLFKNGHEVSANRHAILQYLRKSLTGGSSLKGPSTELTLVFVIWFQDGILHDRDVIPMRIVVDELARLRAPTANRVCVLCNFVSDVKFRELSSDASARHRLAGEFRMKNISIQPDHINFVPFQQSNYMKANKMLSHGNWVTMLPLNAPTLSVEGSDPAGPRYSLPPVAAPPCDQVASLFDKPWKDMRTSMHSVSSQGSVGNEHVTFPSSTSNPSFAGHNDTNAMPPRTNPGNFPKQQPPRPTVAPFLSSPQPPLQHMPAPPPPQPQPQPMQHAPAPGPVSPPAPYLLSPEAQRFQRDIQDLEQQLNTYKDEEVAVRRKHDELSAALRSCEIELRTAEAKIKGCEGHIASLRPVFQMFINEGNQQRLQQEQQNNNGQGAGGAQSEGGAENTECVICMCAIASTDAYALGCGHVFHKTCAKGWLTRSDSCPICKQDVSTLNRQSVVA